MFSFETPPNSPFQWQYLHPYWYRKASHQHRKETAEEFRDFIWNTSTSICKDQIAILYLRNIYFALLSVTTKYALSEQIQKFNPLV